MREFPFMLNFFLLFTNYLLWAGQAFFGLCLLGAAALNSASRLEKCAIDR